MQLYHAPKSWDNRYNPSSFGLTIKKVPDYGLRRMRSTGVDRGDEQPHEAYLENLPCFDGELYTRLETADPNRQFRDCCVRGDAPRGVSGVDLSPSPPAAPRRSRTSSST